MLTPASSPEALLAENDFNLPDNPKDFLVEAIIPYYKALEWRAAGDYSLDGPIIVFPTHVTAFWQKVKLQNHNHRSSLIEKLQHSLFIVKSHIEIFINVCESQNNDLLYKLATVLDDTNIHFNSIESMLDGL